MTKPKNKMTGVRFTLLEVVVAMAVLTVLMALLLQFFSGAQRIWLDAENKHSVYSDARVAMDLMSSMLQTTYYNENETPFIVKRLPSEAGEDKIYFAAKSPLRPRGNADLFFALFRRNTTNNELEIGTFCDTDNNFADHFFPFPGGENFDSIKTKVKSKLNGTSVSATPATAAMVIPNVMSLNFRPAWINYANPTAPLKWEDSGFEGVPAVIEIRMTLLDPQDYARWAGMAPGGDRDKFLTDHLKTFSRVVNLGDRQ